MPRVPYPDPLYPVVWADTPNAPDTSSAPTGGSAPPDDDPFQLHLDEALVRKADNDAVDQWKSLSGPWFASRGEDAATRWKDIEQSLNEIVHRPFSELETERQRRMCRDIMTPRLEAWGDEARAHATREVEHLAQHDPQRAQNWLNAHGATIGDPAKVDKLHRMLQPYAAEQQQEGLADQIRGETSDLPAQHAAVDAMRLDPAIAEGLKQRLADMAESDRKATEKEQDAAFSRVKAAVLNPETQSLRGISPSDYYMLTPERLDAVRAAMAANLRGERPTANPELFNNLADHAAQGGLTVDEAGQASQSLSGGPRNAVDEWYPEGGEGVDRASTSFATIPPITSAVFNPSKSPAAQFTNAGFSTGAEVGRDLRDTNGTTPVASIQNDAASEPKSSVVSRASKDRGTNNPVPSPGIITGKEMPEKQAAKLAKQMGINPDVPIYIGGGGDAYGFNTTVKDYAKRNNGNFLCI